MLRQIMVVECDICGATERPIQKVNRNEDYYELPEGWVHSDANHNFCICPRCWHKLNGGDVD